MVIGFEGSANSLEDNLGNMTVVCGSLGIAQNGDALLTRSSESGLIGDQKTTGSLLTAICNSNELAIGFVPSLNDFVSGFEWICQQVSHSDGALRFGATTIFMFGPSTGSQLEDQRCPLREVVTEVFGTAGLSVDSMGLGCSAISTVLCGDGVLVAPETCDDGNLIRRDGCDQRCQLE